MYRDSGIIPVDLEGQFIDGVDGIYSEMSIAGSSSAYPPPCQDWVAEDRGILLLARRRNTWTGNPWLKGYRRGRRGSPERGHGWLRMVSSVALPR